MTITLDQIRDTKFHVSKRNGYEVTEVDRFVDQVEESFAQLTEENNSLKKQVEALKTAQANAERAAQAKPAADEQPTQEQPRVQEAPAAKPEPQPVVTQPAPATSGTVGDGVEKIVVTTTPEASAAVVRLVQLHTEQVETMEAEAKADAKAKIDQANAQAKKITDDAQAKAKQVEANARTNADKLIADAQRNADDLGRQVDNRRTELFSALESERDELQTAVDELRDYEQRYRNSFTEQLREALESVQGRASHPATSPVWPSAATPVAPPTTPAPPVPGPPTTRAAPRGSTPCWARTATDRPLATTGDPTGVPGRSMS